MTISLCQNCLCMTRTIKGHCGKCGAKKGWEMSNYICLEHNSSACDECVKYFTKRIEQLEADYSSEVQAKELAIEKVIALSQELAKLKKIKEGAK